MAFYRAKEAVMFGLLAIVAGLVLMMLFITYEVFRGRV